MVLVPYLGFSQWLVSVLDDQIQREGLVSRQIALFGGVQGQQCWEVTVFHSPRIGGLCISLGVVALNGRFQE